MPRPMREAFQRMMLDRLDESVIGIGARADNAAEALYPHIVAELLGHCELAWVASDRFRCELRHERIVPFAATALPCPIATAEAADPVTALGLLALDIAGRANLIAVLEAIAKETKAELDATEEGGDDAERDV